MKPYYFLLSTAILFILASVLISPFELNFDILDTYIIIPVTQFLRYQAAGLLVFAAFYRYLNRYLLLKLLTWLHILSFIFLPLIFAWMSYSFNKSLAVVEISNQASASYFERNQQINNYIFLVLIAMQILPLFNLLYGIIKRNKKGAQ